MRAFCALRMYVCTACMYVMRECCVYTCVFMLCMYVVYGRALCLDGMCVCYVGVLFYGCMCCVCGFCSSMIALCMYVFLIIMYGLFVCILSVYVWCLWKSGMYVIYVSCVRAYVSTYSMFVYVCILCCGRRVCI